MDIGNKIKKIREERGISTYKLADIITNNGFKISQSAISKIENGNKKLDVETLNKIAEALGVTTNSLNTPTINIEMNSTEHITPKVQKLLNTSDSVKQVATNSQNIRVFQLAGDDNELILDLTNELLYNIKNSIEFFPSILGGNDFENLKNGIYKTNTAEADNAIKKILKDFSKASICIGKTSVALYNIYSHTQNLINPIIGQNKKTTIKNLNFSNLEYKNLGQEILNLIEFELFKIHKNK